MGVENAKWRLAGNRAPDTQPEVREVCHGAKVGQATASELEKNAELWVMEFDLEAEKQEIFEVPGLLRAAKNSKKRSERKAIRKAFDVALDAHKDIRRKSRALHLPPHRRSAGGGRGDGLGTTSIVCAPSRHVEDTYMTWTTSSGCLAQGACIIDGQPR